MSVRATRVGSGRCRRSIIPLLAAALVTPAIVTIATTAAPAQAAAPAVASADNPALVVTSTGDGADAAGADGVCATTGGTCTLRAAIEQANFNRGSDRIEFAIGGSGTRRIDIGSPLPPIADPTGGVTIDGYTQPGASPNTATRRSNATIRVEIDGRGEERILLIQSAENTVRGLALYGADTAIELRTEGADGNTIAGNFLGTNAAASYTRSDGVGIILNLGPDRNRLGTPDRADRNVIAGSGRFGIRINHGETSENRIQNNIIGLSPDGTRNMGHVIGIDVQWWTWGNLVGGPSAAERNVISGNDNGVDLSHKATGNLVIGNYLGTTLDGRDATAQTRNERGLIVKDDAKNNYVADNVIAGVDRDYAIWHKHNYTGGNTFVNNRIGVGSDGSDIGSGDSGMLLRGHDDVYYGNTFANNGRDAIVISNTSVRDGATFEPDEQTVRNAIRRGTYHGNNGDRPIVFGTTCCPHPDEDTPDIDGVGPGQVNGNSTCARCEVEVYVSGTLNADGTITPGTGTIGLTWIGTVFADGSGNYSMASPDLRAGARVAVAAITPNGESSDFSSVRTIPSRGSGLVPNPSSPTTPAPPPVPRFPTPYQPTTFTCSYTNGTLSWTNAGATEYYVFATTAGTDTYLGGHTGTTLQTGPADSYRVTHWTTGGPTRSTCTGPGGGPGPGDPFSCSVSNGVLSWTDAGAGEYYVHATTGGVDTYLGGHTTTSLRVAPADSYRVTYWVGATPTRATCAGGTPTFSCSVSGGVLSWVDAGAEEYYVFSTTGGADRYLGGHRTTSLNVAPADSYRVTHWLTGNATRATCSP